MDNIINELKELFQKDCHLVICENNVKIKETGVDAKLKEVIIKNIDEENSFCVKLDVNGQKFSPYFNPHYPNIGKGVDAVLFTKVENDYFLFFIEMKSTNFNTNEVINKFKSSSAFIQYINNLLIQFSDFNLTNFNVGFMVCYLKNQKSVMRTEQSLNFDLKGKDKYPNTTILEIYKSSAKHFEFSIDTLIENHRPFPFSLYKKIMQNNTGTIIRSTGSWYNIRQENGEIVQGRLRGKFKIKGLKVTNPIAVGDIVGFIDDVKEENTVIINSILPRQNYIVRKSTHNPHHAHMLASNMDQAILIATYKSPQTSLGFIDRFLVSAEGFRIPTLIVFNKIDLLNEEELDYLNDLAELYTSLGYECLFTSVETGEGIEEFRNKLDNKISFLSGHSGAGKSSLINKSIPNVEIPTSEISDFSDKGTHTTTFAEMHVIDENTFIIDSPGIKELGLANVALHEVSHYFPEMRALLNQCKYHDCTHTHEPQCAVYEGTTDGTISPSRYVSYLSILDADDYKKNPKKR